MNPAPIIPGLILAPAPTNVFMLDIETAGLDFGSIILEIAIAEFNPDTTEILREWSTTIDLLDSARLGMTLDAETADFHLRKKYSSDLRGPSLWRALNTLDVFLHLASESPVVWIWGMDFDTGHLKSACEAANYKMPWHYTQGRDARTVWNLAFPNQKPETRQHRAAEDVRSQIGDLCKALKIIKPREN